MDKAGHEAKFKLKKYNTRDSQDKREPDEILEFEDNVFLDEGIGAIWDLATGLGSPNVFNNTNTNIGVGNGTTAEDSTQTGLQGGSTAFASMDTGYPSRSGTTVTFYCTFGGTEANFAWEELTVVNDVDDTGLNINRKAKSMGTKVSGQEWEVEVQLTIT